MADPIISIERIRKSAQEAARRPGVSEQCPPELELYRHVWMREYRQALEQATFEQCIDAAS